MTGIDIMFVVIFALAGGMKFRRPGGLVVPLAKVMPAGTWRFGLSPRRAAQAIAAAEVATAFFLCTPPTRLIGTVAAAAFSAGS